MLVCYTQIEHPLPFGPEKLSRSAELLTVKLYLQKSHNYAVNYSGFFQIRREGSAICTRGCWKFYKLSDGSHDEECAHYCILNHIFRSFKPTPLIFRCSPPKHKAFHCRSSTTTTTRSACGIPYWLTCNSPKVIN